MMNRLWWFLPLVLFAVLGVIFVRQLGVNPTIVPQQTTGKMLPVMALQTISDQARVATLADLPQQPFLLMIWGSWCPTCAKEQPYLMSLHQRGVVMVGVNYKDKLADALNFLEASGNPFLINVQDPAGQYGLDLGVTGAPETFVIDGQHRIQQHIIGEIDETVWSSQIEPCLNRLASGRGACL